MGKLVARLDPRILIAGGALSITGVMLVLGGINSQSSVDSLFWPLILRGAGTVMMFLPLSLATLGPIPKKDVYAASGFYNLTRQLGGSIGIAILTTVLAQRMVFHSAMLNERLSIFNAMALERLRLFTGGFMAKGADHLAAQHRAVAAIKGSISGQAAVMAFGDLFLIVAWVFLGALPLIFFLGRPPKRPAAGRPG
jgi:DHA2 family multidrug resistance protein